MILVLRATLQSNDRLSVLNSLEKMGMSGKLVQSDGRPVVLVEDDVSTVPTHHFSQIEGVEKIVRVNETCPLALSGGGRRVSVGDMVQNTVSLGSGSDFVVIAGPCSVEGREQVLDIASRVRDAGAHMLRGGAFKPRTSPYDFSGLGMEGLEFLREAKKLTGLPVVSEVLSCEQVEQAESYVDMFQVGARNMYNYELLKELGRASRPVLLKRAMSATVDELLHSAEYVLLGGNENVVLCERGIRTFEQRTRNTLDLSAVALLKATTNLPVVVDPSHATGRRDLVRPMSRAAIACGADGVLIETHNDPHGSISDSEQAIGPESLATIVDECKRIAVAMRSPGSSSKPQTLVASGTRG